MSGAADLLARARRHGAKIATAESCTGGLIAAAITDVAGSSDVFDRGFVTYSNAAKTEMLGVSEATLAAHGAVSEAVAHEMAEGALARSAATLAVSVTGIAGPGDQSSSPRGASASGWRWQAGKRSSKRWTSAHWGATKSAARRWTMRWNC